MRNWTKGNGEGGKIKSYGGGIKCIRDWVDQRREAVVVHY